MIKIIINEPKFEYDIHSLVKAFFPKEEVKVLSSSECGEEYDYEVNYAKDCFQFSDKTGKELSKFSVIEGAGRTEEKNTVKKLIYLALKDVTGRELVWGDLTGIRPTKIARKMLDEGKTEEEIYGYMKKTYFVSDEKTNLSIDIAKREREILKPLRQKGYSVYIGIPFCPTTCLYCSFTSNPIAMWRSKVNDYLTALEKEIAFTGRERAGLSIDTIYIGGGTPTSLNEGELERLLSFIENHLDTSSLLEYTVEAGRADSITLEKLKIMKRHGVTRISVNPQTMNQKTLDFIGRRHTTEDVKRAFFDTREAGFTNINMDIILGLPGEGEPEVINTLNEIEKLSPDSLTVHSLAMKRGSRLYEHISEHGYDTMINTDATMKLALDSASSMNMKPYYLYRQKNMAGNFENTGYATEGKFGLYNILIMEELEPIVAMGPGSVSKIITPEGKLVRNDNVKDVSLYIEKIDEMLKRKLELFSFEKN